MTIGKCAKGLRNIEELPEQKSSSFLSGKFPSLRNLKTARATLSRTPSSKEQLNSTVVASFSYAVCRSNLSSPPAVSYTVPKVSDFSVIYVA
jgi:hypothetical protein